MGDADEPLFVTEGDDPVPVLKVLVPVALRRDAVRLASSSKNMRLAMLLPRFGHEPLRQLAHYLCGIIVPHTSANR